MSESHQVCRSTTDWLTNTREKHEREGQGFAESRDGRVLRPAVWRRSRDGAMNDENREPTALGEGELESTASLLGRARGGEEQARDELMSRYLPVLNRWARGRLPDYARDLAETADLVQLTLVRGLKSIDRFESQGEGAFLGYLRQILLNAVRDEIRRASRRPGHDPLPETQPLPDRGESALEKAIGRERMERYEEALEKLEERQKQAVMLRLEFGYTHAQIAEAIDAPSANAARMVTSRALLRLTELLRE